VTFLYKLVEKAAQRSYGLNVARLAELPPELLAVARAKSHELEEAIQARQQAAGRPRVRYAALAQKARRRCGWTVVANVVMTLVRRDADAGWTCSRGTCSSCSRRHRRSTALLYAPSWTICPHRSLAVQTRSPLHACTSMSV